MRAPTHTTGAWVRKTGGSKITQLAACNCQGKNKKLVRLSLALWTVSVDVLTMFFFVASVLRIVGRFLVVIGVVLAK